MSLTVTFNDKSTGSISKRVWDFGDGQSSSSSSSSGISISHTYNKEGLYSPSLEVTRFSGTKKVSKSNAITVTAISTPIATATPISTPVDTTTPISTTVVTATPTAVPSPTATPKPIVGIKGRVTDTNNDPVSEMFVDVFNSSGSNGFINGGTTDDNGNYFIITPPGSYTVAVDTSGTNFIPEVYDNVELLENATVVVVTDGLITENIDFVLEQGVLIKGKLSDPNGNPFASVIVKVFDSNTGELKGSVQTDENGEFTISLPPGVCDFFVEFFGGVFELATGVDVRSGLDGSIFNFVVSILKISGVVKDVDGEAVSEMFVKVSEASTGSFVNFDLTDENGAYVVAVIPGDYAVRVDVTGTNFNSSSEEVSVISDDVVADFVLIEGSLIRGNVSSVDGGPISGVEVEAFGFDNGSWKGSSMTDLDGDYVLSLQRGLYKVGIDGSNTGFASQFFENSNWDNANQVEVIQSEETVGVDFVLQKAGLITGRVTDNDGGPLNNILINLFDFNSDTWVGFALTNLNGTYSVSVAEGVFGVEADGRDEGFSSEVFRDSEGIITGVNVEAGDVVSGVDFNLDGGGSVSGIVTSGDELLTGIEVNAFTVDSNNWISGTVTSNGIYTLEGLTTGEYRIKASDPDGRFSIQYYNKVNTDTLAAPVVATNGENTTDINFDLVPGGSISGIVTDEDLNVPAEAIKVEAYELETGRGIGSDESDVAGKYSITVPAGEFKLRAFDIGGTFTSEYFNDALSWNRADTISVDLGEVEGSINFALSSGNFISGRVNDDQNRLIKDVNIEIYDFDTDNWIGSVRTDIEGKYRVVVPAGRYRVLAVPGETSLITAVYDNSEGWDKATPVSVTDANDAENINFRLSGNVSTLRGVVKDVDGEPLQNIVIQVFDFDKELWMTDGKSNSQGGYKMSVPSGRYRLRILPLNASSTLATEFYDDSRSWDFADVVKVEGGEDRVLKEIVLDKGNALSGTIRSDKGDLLPDVLINIYKFNSGSWISSTITDDKGEYSFNGVPDGSYRVKATPPSGKELANIYYNGSDNWQEANQVVINGGDVSGIDFVLGEGGIIAGRVVDSESEEPLSGIVVDAFDFSSGAWVDKGVTNGLGNYIIDVPAGVYLVRTNAVGTEFVDEFFDDVIDSDLAKAVTVTVDKDAVADFRLTGGVIISGIVNDESGEGIRGVQMNLFDFDSNVWINNVFTDSNGEYSVVTLPGTYRIEFKAPVGSNFVDLLVDDPVETDNSGEVVLQDFILMTGRGDITGTVKSSDGVSLEGIKIVAFENDTEGELGFDKGSLKAIGFTDSNGNYSLSLTPGIYRMCATGEGTTTPYITEYFDDVTQFGSATPFNLSVGTVETANFELITGACIKGRVTDSDLLSVPGTKVRAFDVVTGEMAGSDVTDNNGNYTICLPDGTYKVWAWNINIFKPQFFSKTEDVNKAKEVTLSGNDRTGIDFELVDR